MGWWERLTCQLTILRLTTRGAARFRRAGLRGVRTRFLKDDHGRWAKVGSSGGKVALLGDGLAGDPDCFHEADSVRVVAALLSGVGHQGLDGVVATQIPRYLL